MNQHQSIQEVKHKVDIDSTVLFRTSSVFPFDLFPSEVIVYATKVDIVDQIFIATQEVKTVMIPDIFQLEVQSNPFFATMLLTNRQPMLPLIKVSFLKKKDAFHLRALVQGLVAAHYSDVDFANLSPSQLVNQAMELGKTEMPAV